MLPASPGESLAVTASHHQRASEDHTTMSLSLDTAGPGDSRLRKSPQLPEQLHSLCRVASLRRGWWLVSAALQNLISPGLHKEETQATTEGAVFHMWCFEELPTTCV